MNVPTTMKHTVTTIAVLLLAALPAPLLLGAEPDTAPAQAAPKGRTQAPQTFAFETYAGRAYNLSLIHI